LSVFLNVNSFRTLIINGLGCDLKRSICSTNIDPRHSVEMKETRAVV